MDESGLADAAFARRDGNALEVEALRLEALLRPPFKRATTVPTRTHFHTLLFVEAGDCLHHVDFEPHRVRAGDLLIIPEGRVQAFDKARSMRGYIVLFTARYLAECDLGTRNLASAAQSLLRAGVRLRLGDESGRRLLSAMETLAHHTRSLSAHRYLDEVVATAFALLVFVAAGLPEAAVVVDALASQDKLVARFIALLETRFSAWRRVSTYAESLRVSTRTLDRRLLATHGQTAHQIIAARLVLESKRLLTRQDLPVKNIAYELGFSEPNNFTRFFASQTGLTPVAFRRALDETKGRRLVDER